MGRGIVCQERVVCETCFEKCEGEDLIAIVNYDEAETCADCGAELDEG